MTDYLGCGASRYQISGRNYQEATPDRAQMAAMDEMMTFATYPLMLVSLALVALPLVVRRPAGDEHGPR